MSKTIPTPTHDGHKQDADKPAEHPDARLVRTVMARECDTVNEYYALAEQATSEAIRALLMHLADEEKEHIAECSLVLAKLDASYGHYLTKPIGHVDPALADDASAPSQSSTADEEATSAEVTSLDSGPTLSSRPTQLTVGSLFRVQD